MNYLCDNPEAERMWYEDLERYRQRSGPGIPDVPLGIADERSLTALAAGLVRSLERQTLTPDRASLRLRDLYERTGPSALGCRIGWLVDYIRLTYQYL